MNEDFNIEESIDASLVTLISEDEDSARAYLAEEFLSHAMVELRSLRNLADFTQEQLASKLETTQSVISRTEKDLSGSITLRRYAEWVTACGFAPNKLVFQSFISARNQAIQSLKETLHQTSVTIDVTAMPDVTAISEWPPIDVINKIPGSSNQLKPSWEASSGGLTTRRPTQFGQDVVNVPETVMAYRMRLLNVDVPVGISGREKELAYG